MRALGTCAHQQHPAIDVTVVLTADRASPSFTDGAMPVVEAPDQLTSSEGGPLQGAAGLPTPPLFDHLEVKTALGRLPWQEDWTPDQDRRHARWARYVRAPRLDDGTFDPLALFPLADLPGPAIWQQFGPDEPDAVLHVARPVAQRARAGRPTSGSSPTSGRAGWVTVMPSSRPTCGRRAAWWRPPPRRCSYAPPFPPEHRSGIPFVAVTKIRELLAEGQTFSFEFFPPKSDEAARELEKAIGELEAAPAVVRVGHLRRRPARPGTAPATWSPTSSATPSMTAMAHLTCIAHTRDQLVGDRGRVPATPASTTCWRWPAIRPQDLEDYPTDLEYAMELIELIREHDDFSIGVAAHPELHPRSSATATSDRRFLASEAGRRRLRHHAVLLRGRAVLPHDRRARRAGQHHAGDAGRHPGDQRQAGQAVRGSWPAPSSRRIWPLGSRPSPTIPSRCARSASTSPPSCAAELLDQGVPGLHFYTLNRSTATREIYANLGLGS